MDAATLPVEAALLASIDDIDAATWNSLSHDGVPFLRHEFLAALEHTRAVGGDSGWQARPLVLRQQGRVLGAVPLYEKRHSYGEFVFDFAWANAFHEHGLRYYPKLVAATPFTPATGPRLLVAPDADTAQTHALLAQALNGLVTDGRWSSVHVQFARQTDVATLSEHGFLPRIDCQFLWENRGYANYADFLATFTAEKRKKANRERRRVVEAGIRHEWRDGSSLDADDWKVIHALLATTFHRHGHEPYLPADFFLEVSRHAATEPRVLLAHDGQALVAAALFFRGTDTLYGRYWGCVEAYHSLHFETCYHQGIDYCIREGIQRFEPGTQGEHKIARGFAPTLTHSAHRIADGRFEAAIARYLEAERDSVDRYAREAGQHTPFRRDLELGELP